MAVVVCVVTMHKPHNEGQKNFMGSFIHCPSVKVAHTGACTIQYNFSQFVPL